MLQRKEIKVSAAASPLKIELEMHRHHFCILVPDRPVPCSIYIFFKGKYLEVVKKNHIAPLALIAKMYEDENFFFYILKSESHLFDFWAGKRHSFETLPHLNLSEKDKKIEFRKAAFIRMGTEKVVFAEDNVTTRRLMKEAEDNLRSIVHRPTLQWFFEMDMSEPIIQHSARVAYKVLLFLTQNKPIAEKMDIDSLIEMSIIHQLEGDPRQVNFDEANRQVIEKVKSLKIGLAEKLAEFLMDHCELFDGGGPEKKSGSEVPVEILLFSIADRFDHELTRASNVTKNKAVDTVKANLQKNAANFHPGLLKSFLDFTNLLQWK